MFVISVQTWANRRGDLPESPCLFLWGSAGAKVRREMRVEKFEFLLFRKKIWGQRNGATLQHYNHYNCNPRHAPCYIYIIN